MTLEASKPPRSARAGGLESWIGLHDPHEFLVLLAQPPNQASGAGASPGYKFVTTIISGSDLAATS